MEGVRWMQKLALAIGLVAGGGVCAAQQPAPPPPKDPTAALIQSLEQQYANGVQLYRQGQLDESRLAFDATLDRLLSTNISIRNHPRLQHELDSLLDRIHALESDTLAYGGLNSARPQATPLDRVPELTFPVDPKVRAAIEAEAAAEVHPAELNQLPIQLNDPVLRYVHYFTTNGRQDLANGFRRAGRYRDMVERIFRAAGVPADLLYLAQLESDYDPRLVSRAGARGMWQFMASRSDDYGLKRTKWVDEREDPEKSTEAAAHHLKDLYAEFGDWYLAMAAYEAGPGTVQAIVARTGYADYWKLYDMNALPKYLRNYVPVILATALIARDPAKYGITDFTPDSPDEVSTIILPHPLDLNLAAECARVTVGDLQHLNPSLLHLEAPAGFALKLPAGAQARFQRGLDAVPAAQWLHWRLHWARPGDTWAQLARQNHLSLAALQTANPAIAAADLAPGLPVALPRHSAASPAPAPARLPHGTRVKKSLTAPHV